MKKTIIAAAALVAMTACNKTLIETPMTDSEYGYINLGITADTEMVVTKAGETTDYLVALWKVDTKSTEKINDDTFTSIVDFCKLTDFTNKQPKGTYYMEAQNVLPGEAHPAGGAKGQIHRYGKSEYFTLEAGKSSDVRIETEIQNTGVTVDYTEGFKEVFPSAEVKVTGLNGENREYAGADVAAFADVTAVLVDYYVEKIGNAQQIEITPDKFGGNYYLEASTLFRDQSGVDMPAEFIIPNCKIQSNFTFTMASSGDPSTFTFTMDAFPDYTRFDTTKKVLAAIQIITESQADDVYRKATKHSEDHDLVIG